MNQNRYIVFLLYRAYIERNPLLKQQLLLCGQQYLGLAFNLSGLSPIIQLIIQFLEPEYIIYLIIDDYNFVKDPLFSHIIHLNNMIAELSPQLLCKFCMKAIIGRAGCAHYKLDCKLGYSRHIHTTVVTRNIVQRYYPSGGSWVLDWDLYIHIGHILREKLRKESWELRRRGGDDNCGQWIKKYFYTYYYWWKDEDYDTFIKTCSKLIF